MDDFPIGLKIPLETRDTAEVLQVLGSGGQGTVYRVRYAGDEFALKWYQRDKIKNHKKFRKNLENNILVGAPNNSFLWPLFLTNEKDKSFGYVMNLRPKNYSEFSDVLNKKVSFKNLCAICDCALNIVNSFGELHRKGYSYQDLNDGNFFVDANDGKVLICDNDNAAPDQENLGIGGKPGYMAPEVVRGKAKPNTLTDLHSLGVVLFKLFVRHDPLMGQRYVDSVCITEAKELELYGTNPIFIFDPKDTSNRPVTGVHRNPIVLWPKYPKYIQDAFIRTFCDGMKNPNVRMTEHEWQKLLTRLRSEILTCPYGCGNESFISNISHSNGVFACPKCKSDCSYPMQIKLNGYIVNLFPKTKIYKCYTTRDSNDYQTVTGEVILNKNNPGIWGIRNLSDDGWLATSPDGSKKSIPNGAVIPISNGTEIEFAQVHGKIQKGGN